MSRLVKFFLFSILILTIACRNKKEEIVIIPDYQKNHLQRNRLLGNVKTVTTTLYSAEERDGKVVAKREISTVIQQYSMDGFLKEVVTLDKKHDTVLHRVVHYNAEAKETMWEEFDSLGKKIAYSTYEYDMNGFRVKEKIFRDDSLQVTFTYANDGQGNAIEVTQDYPAYSITNRLSYNTLGLLSRIDEFEPSGKLFKYITINYDQYGDEINRRAFKNAQEELEYTYTKYNDRGYLLKVIYEDKKHLMRDVLDYQKYDAKGNWKYEIRRKNKDVVFLRKRTVEYYE